MNASLDEKWPSALLSSHGSAARTYRRIQLDHLVRKASGNSISLADGNASADLCPFIGVKTIGATQSAFPRLLSMRTAMKRMRLNKPFI